jgi:TolA-binding protein
VSLRRPWSAALLLVAPLLAAGQDPSHAAAPAAKQGPTRSGSMSDAQAAELAKEALHAENAVSIKAALARLKGHSFKSSKVPERELVLYAQGILEARVGNLPAAAVALKKLERQWPKSPFMGEANTILAEDALNQKRYKDAEGRLHQALASDMPAERKRGSQELLIWLLVEQGRPQEALPIVQALKPLNGGEKPSERGLAAIAEVLTVTGARDQAEAARKDFARLYPSSELTPRLELAWGRLLGRSGDAKGAAQVLRKLVKDFPKSSQADDARLALASLLTDGSLPDAKDLPSAESLLAEVRKGGKNLPKGTAQVVELRLLIGKTQWEECLNLVERMDPVLREGAEVRKLWAEAWNAWVGQRLEKGFPGELLVRMKPGHFGALDPRLRLGVAELFAVHGLLEVLPSLLADVPVAQRTAPRNAALAKVQPEAQPRQVLKLMPPKGDTPEEALIRARAEAALENWPAVRSALPRALPGPERVKVILRLLQRPLGPKENAAQRHSEAEGWLSRLTEKVELREPVNILVGDLRLQAGDARGALAIYPGKSLAPEQRGWVALMRAQAMLKLGQREQARSVIKESREEQGFKGQRDAIARSLGAY